MNPVATPDPVPEPQVDSYLGQLRIKCEAAPVSVHIGTTEDFVLCKETLVADLAIPGVAFVGAPVGENRFVRLVDRYGNCSRSVRASVSRVAQITADGAFFPGRFTTALTGARATVASYHPVGAAVFTNSGSELVDLRELTNLMRRALLELERRSDGDDGEAVPA